MAKRTWTKQTTEGGAALELALLVDYDLRRPPRTHREVAELLGINKALVSHLINGLANPGSQATAALYFILGIDPILWWTSRGGERGDLLKCSAEGRQAALELHAYQAEQAGADVAIAAHARAAASPAAE